ncbi:hypothetical protein ABZ907_20335 [Nonomuraea wenchangensis]
MSRRSTLLLGPLSTVLALLLMTALPQPAQAYTQRTYVTPGVWSANQGWGTA